MSNPDSRLTTLIGRRLAKERSLRIILLSVCLVLAAGMTAYRGLADRSRTRSSVTRRPGNLPYKLSALRIFSDVLQLVQDWYVDPARIRPRQMLLSGLRSLQREVAEVIVHPLENGKKVVVKVGVYRRTFNVSAVNSLHMLYKRLKEIVGFVERHLDRQADIREVEYAAINGALHTLDPHSVLWNPQTYAEMKVGTRGSFGGLGIVISIKKGVLTVIAPIDDTPASRAGIRAGDRIVRIGSESTVNMTLNEAVNRLRGEPGTQVVIYVERTGQPEPLRFKLKRAVIRIKSVESRMLEGNVGYVRIKHFIRSTTRELEKHLVALRKKHLNGLVLDLYNNPGGLLEQAIKTADMFLNRGVIVTTVGNAGKQRDEKRASSWSPVGEVPMVVLVNAGSASASEIVAGALKNQDRAVVVGQTTFGKGSVQVLYDNYDGSALKLTIALYLTPGDVSIQSVGIMPDVRSVPVKLEKTRIEFFGGRDRRREQDLEAHLDPYQRQKIGRPVAMLRYLESGPLKSKSKSKRSDASDGGGGADRAVIYLARDLLLRGYGASRKRVLNLAKEFFASRRQDEESRISAALLARGIDWGVQPASEVPMLEAEVKTDKPDGVYSAGDTVKITVTVSNLGLGPAYRVRAISDADSAALRDLEFLLGRIQPGANRTFTVPVQIPKDTRSSIWRVRLKFAEEYGHQPPDLVLRMRIRGRRRAIFAAQYQFIDDVKGNGDGLAQWGESLRLRVTVRNIGAGKSMDTVATLKNLNGPEVFIHRSRGRISLGKLSSGQERSGVFVFDLRRTGSSRVAKFELTLFDNEVQEGVRERILLPVSRSERTPVEVDGWVVIRRRAPVTAGADPKALLLGHARRGAAYKLVGRAGGRYRIVGPAGWPGFVSVQDAERVTAAPQEVGTVALERHFHITPPLVRLHRYPLATTSSELMLSGLAHDNARVKDVYVEVSNPEAKLFRRKVYYQSNRRGKNSRVLPFATRVPLLPGLNYITVVARENTHVRTHRIIAVRRDTRPRNLTAFRQLARKKHLVKK